MSDSLTYYEILGISRTASAAEVTQAYHRRAREFHPDSQQGQPNIPKFMEAKGAYNVLGNAERRAAYDATLPPMEESDGASGTTATGTASGSGETSGTGEGGDGSASGTGTTETSGTKSAGATNMDTAPHPRNETKKEREKQADREYPGTSFTYEARTFPYTRSAAPHGPKFQELNKTHDKVREMPKRAEPEIQPTAAQPIPSAPAPKPNQRYRLEELKVA